MIWEELVKTALLGTERSQLSMEILAQLQQQGVDVKADSATVLLQSAAIQSQMRKAGFVLKNFTGNLPEPAIVSVENFCNSISSRQLKSILEGPYKKILPEFIFVAHQNQKIIPPEHLPALFQESLRQHQLWQTALPIIGNHGNWLLQQNPAWKRLTQEAKVSPYLEEEIYPILENKFQIWGSDDVAFRCGPSDFNELRAFWQTVQTPVYENFIQKAMQILVFREEMIRELTEVSDAFEASDT